MSISLAAEASLHALGDERPSDRRAEIEQGAPHVEVNASCQKTVSFRIALHDNRRLDVNALGLHVTPSILGGNASVGTVSLDPPQVLGPRDAIVTG